MLECLLPRRYRRSSRAGCLLSIAGLFADVLGWAINPSFLPILHEEMYQVAHQLECVVSASKLPFASVSRAFSIHDEKIQAEGSESSPAAAPATAQNRTFMRICQVVLQDATCLRLRCGQLNSPTNSGSPHHGPYDSQ